MAEREGGGGWGTILVMGEVGVSWEMDVVVRLCGCLADGRSCPRVLRDVGCRGGTLVGVGRDVMGWVHISVRYSGDF